MSFSDRKMWCHPNFTDVDTEAQRGQLIGSRSHRKDRNLTLRCLTTKSFILCARAVVLLLDSQLA